MDLDLDAGGIVAVLGRNGVGKTTLVSTIMGFVRPYEGSVAIDGREIAGARVDVIARAGVGVVPQGRRVFAPLTVDEHLAIASRRSAQGLWTRARILDLLPRLGERLGHRGDQLSGGEQQMLAIARALLGNPRLLLLDEPSDGLAPAIVAQVGEVIREVSAQGMSVVLVEQNLGLAFSVAQNVAVMQKGRIVHEADCAEFESRPDDRRRLLGVD
ncbi:ATP-binding cassette domain-containing protein [Streptomyces sp. ISL-66]|uniref:ABC transporter ATP-binding protein n=1 Tax=Streptomyces sp. ISL-66 TaxID=2819186 RepID=UPI0027E55F4C|nr:ATP-binding cassette domain-containing protein [Streptomyces sp. ISL-66]